MTIIFYFLIGLIAGIAGGALGVGGGTIMVPALVLMLGFSQHQAQGTALAAMLPPVFLLGVWRYYIEENVRVQPAIFIAVGLLVGALLGAHHVQDIPSGTLKKVFGFYLIIVGLKMAW